MKLSELSSQVVKIIIKTAFYSMKNAMDIILMLKTQD
jgi:hypothetical protein